MAGDLIALRSNEFYIQPLINQCGYQHAAVRVLSFRDGVSDCQKRGLCCKQLRKCSCPLNKDTDFLVLEHRHVFEVVPNLGQVTVIV